jgi:hypothetical protein
MKYLPRYLQTRRILVWSPNVVVALVLIFVTIFVGLYDSIALMFWSAPYSISYVLKDWSRHFPILPLLMGIILGHVFWPVGEEEGTTAAIMLRNGDAKLIEQRRKTPPSGTQAILRTAQNPEPRDTSTP